MRGETLTSISSRLNYVYFNPLPSCEGRLPPFNILAVGVGISIHSPHARGDLDRNGGFDAFLISIHSPHARGDSMRTPSTTAKFNFNPLPSCEGRHKLTDEASIDMYISIHSPHARGDGITPRYQSRAHVISIHSPHARGDANPLLTGILRPHFNPLPSCEGRLERVKELVGMPYISIHSPHARGDHDRSSPHQVR